MNGGACTAGEGRAVGKCTEVRATEKGAVFHEGSDFPTSPLTAGGASSQALAQIPMSVLSWELGSILLGHSEEPDLDIAIWNEFHAPFAWLQMPSALIGCGHQPSLPDVLGMVLSPGVSPWSLPIPTSDS